MDKLVNSLASMLSGIVGRVGLAPRATRSFGTVEGECFLL